MYCVNAEAHIPLQQHAVAGDENGPLYLLTKNEHIYT